VPHAENISIPTKEAVPKFTVTLTEVFAPLLNVYQTSLMLPASQLGSRIGSSVAPLVVPLVNKQLGFTAKIVALAQSLFVGAGAEEVTFILIFEQIILLKHEYSCKCI
jgi:hypothetical protein